MSEQRNKHVAERKSTRMATSRGVTRRAFLGMAGVGAAALFIEQVSGGALVATAKELAARAASVVGAGNTATIQFVTINVNEVAITVRDAEDSRKFIEGAQVRVQTLASGKNNVMANAVTNHLGVALINVKDLAEDYENKKYDFYGRVFVSKSGYRDFEIGAMRFYAGQATGVYFQADDGKPYLRCLTFDDYDIQYSEQTMVSTVENTAQHKLKAAIVSSANNIETEVAYWTGEPRTSTYFKESQERALSKTQAVDVSAGSFYEGANGKFAATHEFERQFLYPTIEENDWFLGIDKPLHLHVWVNRTNRFRVDAKLKVIEGVIEKPARETGDEKADTWTLRCHSDEDYYDGLNLDLPDGLPGLNKFNMWVPSFPGVVLFTPTGEFSISYGVTFGIYKDKGGKTEEEKAQEAKKKGDNPPKESDWETTPKKDVAEQIDDKFEDMQKAMQLFSEARDRAKVPGAYGPLSRCGGQHRSSKSFTVSIGAFIKGKYHEEESAWKSEAGVYGKFAFAFNWSHMVLIAGWVPVNFILDITASAMIKLQVECTLPGLLPKASQAVMTGGRVVLPLKFYIAVTVSVGINGVCSVGLRGSAYLYLTPTFGTGRTDVDWEFGADISLVIEVAIFHYEWTFASFEASGSLNDTKRMLSQGDVQGALATASLAELDQMFVPFTEEGMLSTSEFEIVPNLAAQTMSLFAASEAASEEASDPLEVAYTCTYSPYVEGSGVQGGEEPMVLMAMADEGTYTPQVERCVLSGAFANARLQLMLSSNKVVRGVFRLATVRVFNPAANPSYQYRTRMCVAGIDRSSGAISFQNPTVPGNFWAPHNYPEMNRWDLDYASMSLAPHVSGWAWVAAMVYTEYGPESFSAAMMDSHIAIQFSRADTTSYFQEIIIEPMDAIWRGTAKYAYPYNMSFTEMPNDDHGYPCIGFACAVVGFNSPDDTEPAVQYVCTTDFCLKNSTWEIGPIMRHKVRLNWNYQCGMLAIDSVVAFPPTTTARGYGAYNHQFNVAYTVQTVTRSASARKRRFLFFTDHPSSLSNDMFGGKDYNFTGNLTRLDRDMEGTPVHAVIARFTGDMLGVDPDDSPVGKLLAFVIVDYARKLTRDPMECGIVAVEANIGPENKDVDYGGFQMSRDGNLLFFTKVFDGKVPESKIDAGADSGVISEGNPKERYQICAARYINGHFTDPFPLVDLKYSPDSFQYVPYADGWGGNDDAYVFLYSHITDTSAGEADTYMVRMPYLKRLTLIDIAPVEPAIPIGAPLQLEVTSRNDGNVILGGFTVRFTGEDNFSKDVFCDCSYRSYVPNVYDGVNSTLDEVEPDATATNSIFFPGYTNTYAMTVDIPADWPAGNHELKAVILEESYIATTSLTHAEWGEDEQVVACALSYADPEPLVFSMANGADVDLGSDAPAEGEEAAHASDYVEE